MTVVLAAALTFGCVWTAASDPVTSSRRLTVARPQEPRRVVLGRLTIVVVAVVSGAGMLRGSEVQVLLLAGMGSAVVVVVQRLVEASRRRHARGRRSTAVIEFCDALSAELRAGLPPVVAIERAVVVWPSWAPVVTAARLGGDVPGALRAAGEDSGAGGLSAVAAAWEVAERSGAALADVLDQIAVGLRSDDEARAEVVAALAPPRATAKMLAALPIFGLGLGYSMDADPLDFLLHTTVGLGCLGAGVGLALIGLWWVERLADAVER